MFIGKFQLFNYKSYIDSEPLELTPGINIIVGQNNSGKTALLEALTLKLSNEPHKSIKTLPTLFSKIIEDSHSKVSLFLEKEELLALLEQLSPPLGIPMPNEEEFPVEEVEDAISIFKHFQKWLYTPGVIEINLSLSGNLGFEAENGKITQGLSFGL